MKANPIILEVSTVLLALLLLCSDELPIIHSAGAAERDWTSSDGRVVRGRLVEFDGQTATLEVNGRQFQLPLDRLSAADQAWLKQRGIGARGPQSADGASSDGQGDAVRLSRMPAREWPMRDGPPVRGRFVGFEGNQVLVDVSGRIMKFDRHRELDVTNQSYLGQWSGFGPLEEDNPPGEAGDALRAMGLSGWRYWDRTGDNASRDRDSIPFQLFVPEMRPGRAYPLVVFLHGIGEAGSDNILQLKHRDPLVFIEPGSQARNPCFFMAPQHPANWNWALLNYETPGQFQHLTMRAIRRLIMEDYAGQIDPRRIYITGLSSGGLGAVQMCAVFPGTFAAAVPISARGDVAWFEGKPVPPMWFFVNREDDPRIVRSVEQFGRQLPGGAPRPQMTRFDGRGHNAWKEAYDQGGLSRWLFSQELPF